MMGQNTVTQSTYITESSAFRVKKEEEDYDVENTTDIVSDSSYNDWKTGNQCCLHHSSTSEEEKIPRAVDGDDTSDDLVASNCFVGEEEENVEKNNNNNDDETEKVIEPATTGNRHEKNTKTGKQVIGAGCYRQLILSRKKAVNQ